jgi:hypothetical protein
MTGKSHYCSLVIKLRVKACAGTAVDHPMKRG